MIASLAIGWLILVQSPIPCDVESSVGLALSSVAGSPQPAAAQDRLAHSAEKSCHLAALSPEHVWRVPLIGSVHLGGTSDYRAVGFIIGPEPPPPRVPDTDDLRRT